MECQSHLFELPESHHYINCSFLSPLLKSVEQAGINGILSKRYPWEVTPHHFFDDSNTLRALFAKLVNAKQDDIAIMPAVSYGLATAAKNIDLAKGHEIIIAGEQFPSNVYVWKRFCEQHDCTLKIVDPPNGFDQRGQQWNTRIAEAITEDTLVVALGNVHWADGTLFDLQQIGELARNHEAYLIIDGTQSVGALPFDVQQVQPDALICAGYKWLMGPYAMTLAYFGPRLQNGVPLEEGWITRKNSEDFSGLVDYEDQYQPGAQRFDMGERSNFVLVPMMIEALKQIIEWKPKEIQRYCKTLTSDLVKTLPNYGYQIEDADWRGHHMFGIRLPENLSIAKLQDKLDEREIHVSVRGSAVRIAPNVYNNDKDIAALLDTLQTIADN
ncbi:aminotransferase class V-fold PLP-dependent enzyme [Fodinibius halophilus]|uniref:Aminotransferase class V-fold PLP-dependent enzyme n=1 Tax=Fodinibius halophilus TaxID=1736908 RepID=A0A6M1T3D0_9BACT|nr:aminotransferase class V-fold PLP-dependent enzyme [Fodinibius halophilus]NGP87725.1 aminotransferase class V-fold PLP-dependent enzyme [Fodinibius halophilus]